MVYSTNYWGKCMRVAILSDVHANLEALQQVLRALEHERYDALISLGDVVGYGPLPNECVRLVADAASHVILGNHDDALLGRTDIRDFNSYARQAIRWQSTITSPETREIISTYKPFVELPDAFFVHGGPRSPLDWPYILNIYDARLHFRNLQKDICFIGHSHRSVVFDQKEDGAIKQAVRERIQLEEGHRYIINVGSVGQPRDGVADASFALYDSGERVVEIRRVAYDFARTQKLMQDNDLPEFLIRRLQFGE